MNSFLRLFFLCLASLLAVSLAACRSQQADDADEEYPSWPTKVPKGKIDFEKSVRPILVINCMECHNGKNAPQNGNLNLETRKLALTGGNRGPAIIPGDPDNSLLIKALNMDGIHDESMPPTPDKIWGVRMEILTRWIEEGAEWPEDVRLVHPGEITEW